jgi:predicted methyltransferase
MSMPRFVPWFSLLLCSCASRPNPAAQVPIEAATAVDVKLSRVLSGTQRTEQERARDHYRHPRETLEFFGIAEDMTVVELSAGLGWYTAILGPLLSPHGKLTVTNADPNGPPDSEGTKNAKSLVERLNRDSTALGKVSMLAIDWKKADNSLGVDGSADVVVTFRNLHGWISNGVFENVLSASFRLLKSGGTLGVVEHRAKGDGSTDPKVIGETGYVPEAYAIMRIEKAGFKFVARSEINANPKDTKDYPKGVWTLPPTLRLGEIDRDKYLAIGESDRTTLKFTKP